jgi:hypothetical protein
MDDVLIWLCEHEITKWRMSWIAVSEWIAVQPLNNNRRSLKHSVTLNPIYELPINVQMFLGVAKHNYPRSCRAVGHGNSNNIAQRNRRTVVVSHGTRMMPNEEEISHGRVSWQAL